MEKLKAVGEVCFVGQVRVCDSCHDKYGPKEGAAVPAAAAPNQLQADRLFLNIISSFTLKMWFYYFAWIPKV